MTFPAHLLDELARVFAHAALDRLEKEAEQDTRLGDEDLPSEPPSGLLPESGLGKPDTGANTAATSAEKARPCR